MARTSSKMITLRLRSERRLIRNIIYLSGILYPEPYCMSLRSKLSLEVSKLISSIITPIMIMHSSTPALLTMPNPFSFLTSKIFTKKYYTFPRLISLSISRLDIKDQPRRISNLISHALQKCNTLPSINQTMIVR